MGKKSKHKKKVKKRLKKLHCKEQRQEDITLSHPLNPSSGFAGLSEDVILQILRREILNPDPKMKPYIDHKVFREASQQIKAMQDAKNEELIQAIQQYGVSYKEEDFIFEAKQFDSIHGLLAYWKQKYKVKDGPAMKEAIICEVIHILMKRLLPNLVNAEKINEMMQEGYSLLEEGDSKKACTFWLEVWEHLKKRFTPDMKSAEDAERVFDGLQSIYNWCQDLEGELHNAGLSDPVFFEKRIQYCREFCALFPKTEWLTIHNMKRAEAESYFALGMQEKGEAAFQKLVLEFPNYAWGYIGWGDMYCGRPMHKNIQVNYDRAEDLYKKALKIAGKEDKSDVLERLERLGEERRQERSCELLK